MDKEINLKEYKAIDTMCRPFYFDNEFRKSLADNWEHRTMAYTTFAGVMKRLGLKEGDEWKVLPGKPSIQDMIMEMDETGVEIVFIDQEIEWSRRENREYGHYHLEKMAAAMDKSNGRIVGGGGYNPFSIAESLHELERGVKEFGFKYVWNDPVAFGLRADDRRYYPLYMKCLDLGIPACIQVGQCARPAPSEYGHPMHAGEVAFDFPELTLVLTHTGWPWVDEWISMLWRHPKVYGNIGAHFPKDLDPAQVRFMDGRGRDKVFWATNGFGLMRCKKEFLELPIREETKKKVLWENAIKVFNLNSSY